jgi:hypothetical protein
VPLNQEIPMNDNYKYGLMEGHNEDDYEIDEYSEFYDEYAEDEK